jgi:hypothetical protein
MAAMLMMMTDSWQRRNGRVMLLPNVMCTTMRTARLTPLHKLIRAYFHPPRVP